MTKPHYEPIGEDIHCIETGLYRHGLAACYMVQAGDRLAFVDTGTYHTVPRMLELVETIGLTPDQVEYVIPTHPYLHCRAHTFIYVEHLLLPIHVGGGGP